MSRILVVDDDPGVCALISALLRRSGLSSEIVTHGDEAVRRLRISCYDAVLLDLMLPGTWGFDIIRFLKAERPVMLPRVIVMTAASNTTLRDFDSSGIHALLRKPFDIDVLMSQVNTCVASGASVGGATTPPARSASPPESA